MTATITTDALATILSEKIDKGFTAFKAQKEVVQSLKPPTANDVSTFLANTKDKTYLAQIAKVAELRAQAEAANKALYDEIKETLTNASNPDQLAAERGKLNAIKNKLFHDTHAMINHIEDELTTEDSTPFRDLLDTISTSVKVGGATTASRSDLADIRTWAMTNGLKVAAKGRISQTVIDAYDNSKSGGML